MTEREKVEHAEFVRYGIQRIPADVYLWGGYRHSNARNALDAAKRNASPACRNGGDTAGGTLSLREQSLARVP